MKFLTDSQTSQLVVENLRRLGFEVDTVYDHRLEGEKVMLHTLMGLVTMQAAAVVKAEAGQFDRLRDVSRKVA